MQRNASIRWRPSHCTSLQRPTSQKGRTSPHTLLVCWCTQTHLFFSYWFLSSVSKFRFAWKHLQISFLTIYFDAGYFSVNQFVQRRISNDYLLEPQYPNQFIQRRIFTNNLLGPKYTRASTANKVALQYEDWRCCCETTSLQSLYFTQCVHKFSCGRSQRQRGLTRSPWTLGRRDRGFDCRLRHGCLSLSIS
jgi:hypothetical protein